MPASPPSNSAPSQRRLDVPDRMHSLLDAVTNIGRGLELPQVLGSIVDAAVTLTDAEYGALGVIGDGQRLSQFLPVGMADDLAARIGQAPCGRGILGELIRNPVALRLTDLTRHPASFGFPEHHPPMRTFLGVPVRVRGEVFGNLYLTEKRGGADFDAEDEAVLATLANAAGVAVDNARLYHDSRRRERWLEALSEITRALFAGTAAREVLRLIARRACEVADADLTAVLLPVGADGARLTVEVAYGHDAEHVEGAVLPAPGSPTRPAAPTGEPAITADAGGDPRAHALGDEGGGPKGYGPMVSVPLPLDASVCGALRLSRRVGRPAFDDTEVALVSRFADQAAIALELARRRAESEELAVLHERDRIARDLHDLAIQRLFATGMTLQSATRMIESPDAAERVSRAVKDLDTTVQIIRSTIFELRSAAGSRRVGRHRAVVRVRTRAGSPVVRRRDVVGESSVLRVRGPPSRRGESFLRAMTP